MKALSRVGRVLLAACLVGLMIATAATARPARTASSGVVSAKQKTINLKIGEIVPLTGPLASFGPSFYKAGQLAVALGNKAAKAAGYPMHITVSQGDEGTDPTTAVSAARQLAAAGSNCLIGGISTGDSVAVAQAVTIPGKLTQISPTASSAVYDTVHAQGHLTFRTSQTDAFQTLVLAHFMAQQLGGAKGKLVAVGGRNDSYGGPATADFAAAWKKLGGLVTGPVLYDPNATSYDSEAAQLVAGNPVAFVIEDFPETYAKVVLPSSAPASSPQATSTRPPASRRRSRLVHPRRH